MQVQAEAAVDSVMHALLSVGRLMRQRGPGEAFDPGTFWLLKSISSSGPIRITDLATTANLDTSTVSRHVAQLERCGLVVRTPDPDDRRAQRVDLSAEGKQQLADAFDRRRELLAASLADWDHDDITEFQRLLAKFVSAIDTTTTEVTSA